MPANLAVLKQDELARILVVEFLPVLLVIERLLGRRPLPTDVALLGVRQHGKELADRRRNLGLEVNFVQIDRAETALGRHQQRVAIPVEGRRQPV